MSLAAAASASPMPAAPSGSCDSVKRMSSGSSSVTLLDGVADAEVGDVERRERAARDEDDVAGKAQPLDHRVRVVGQELQLACLEVALVDRLVELQDARAAASVAKHIQARPMFVDQNEIFAQRSGHLSAGIR